MKRPFIKKLAIESIDGEERRTFDWPWRKPTRERKEKKIIYEIEEIKKINK